MNDHPAVLPPGDTGDDLELITAFLNRQLDPERVKLVRQRLVEDPDFRELAEPMLLAWSVSSRWSAEPLPPGELERHWDEFTRRAGFAHQRRKARRRRLGIAGLALLAATTGAWLSRDAVREWYVDRRDYVDVANTGGWVTIREGVQARLAAGARLRVHRALTADSVLLAKLRGDAEFRVTARDTVSIVGAYRPLMLRTRAGTVAALRADFAVRAGAETTLVEVRAPERPHHIGGFALPTFVHVENARGSALVNERTRARLVTNLPPEILP